MHPTATEACNTLDDDCDGMVDDGVLVTFHRDEDLDGHGTMDPAMTMTGCMAMAGWSTTADDCDDTNSARNPGLGRGSGPVNHFAEVR